MKERSYSKMNEIIKLKTELQEELKRMNSQLNMYSRKRLLIHIFYSLNDLNNFKENLDAYTLIGIEQLKNKISNELIEDSYSHFFGNLYQIEYSLRYNNYEELQNRLNWTINDVSIMHVQVLQGSSLRDSLGSAFIDRMSGIVKVDNEIITKNNKEFLKLAIINLCSINNCLVDIFNNIGGGPDNKIKKYIETNQISLKSAFQNVEKNNDNLGLLTFIYLNLVNNVKIINSEIDSEKDTFKEIKKLIDNGYKSLRIYDSILMACNLYYLNENTLFDKIYGDIETNLLTYRIDWKIRPFFIKLLLLYLKKNKVTEKIDIDILPTFDSIQTSEILNKLFTNFYINSIDVSISDEDMRKLNLMKDKDIRDKMYKIFLKSKFIEDIEKKRLEIEFSKPHTGYEISDLEVHIKNNNGNKFNNSVMVCFPIKSGQEIRTDTVPESYVYQIMKPFTHFYNNCVVIFITAKKCSQPLINYVKKLQILYKFPIEIIQDKTLCELLKFYELLD